jgi:inorganic triphosphatase YgiF
MEIELKLLVAPEDLGRIEHHPALRELRRFAGHKERLATVYYDTPEFDLAREGVALRVRRTGDRWVQTLKADGDAVAGLHARDELEWPLDSEALDLAALDTSRYRTLFAESHVRERLQPVFRTDFDRAARLVSFPDGTAAELALDHGEIRAGSRTAPISEAEIELKTGDAQRLFELARELARDVPLRLGHESKAERGYALAGAAAAPPRKARPVMLAHGLSAGAGLRRIAAACIAQMQANEAGLLAGRDPEYLHQFRVGLRRLRSGLDVIGMAVGKEAIAPLAEELRWLGAALGPARDWDVFTAETLTRLGREFDASEELQAFLARCAAIRRAHGEAARDAVSSPRYTALLLALGESFARDDLAGLRRPQAGDTAGPDAAASKLAVPVGDFATSVLDKRHRRLCKRGGDVPDAPAGERHRVRIDAKRLRYAAEFFASLYPPKRVRRYVDALEDLQDILGALNDAAVAERLLQEAAAAGPEPVAPRVEGLVRGWIAASAGHELARYRRAWREFEDAKPFWR